MARTAQSRGVSPLAVYLHRRKDEGLTFGEMSRRAIREGLDLSVSRISQIAADNTGRLTEDMIKALAIGTGETEPYIAELDDQRYGFVGKDGRGARSIRDASKEALLEELARRLSTDAEQ